MYEYYPYWCDQCSRGFNSARALEQHNEAVEHFDLFNDTDEEWECDYCDRVCASEQAINQHTRDSHSWHCEHCEIICASKEYLDQHTTKYHLWRCEYCTRVFTSEDAVKQHTRDCHSWRCESCDRLFASLEALSQHTRDHHSWGCSYCDRFFQSEQAANQHIRDSHLWNCEHCDRVCSSEEKIKQHKRKHHSWKCRHCDRICTSEESINQHTRDCHSQVVVYQTTTSKKQVVPSITVTALPPPPTQVSEPLVASCNTLFCGAKFTSIEAYDLHVHKVHQHLCKLCGKVFATVELLIAHRDNMHKFFCTNSGCGAYFHSSEELGSHIRKSHHHRCDICETIFPEIQGLLDHKDSVHKYRCDHDGCGATFTTLGRRVFHSETHRRACDKCKDTFPSVESLIEHRDKAHLFRCDHEGCSALFYNPESRNIHLRINHRHKCDKCKGIFSTVQGLLEHRDSTHLFSCEASGCDAHFSTQSALESHLTVHQHICPKCTKVFSTAVDLSKHIASTHRFRCKEEDCWAWFDRVDGLKKHIELHEKVSNKASMESRATQTEDLFVLNKVSMETRDTQTEDLFYDTEENETGSSVCSEPDLRSDASELSTSPPTSATTPTYIYLNSAPNPFFKTPVSLENASHRSKIPSATGEQDIDSITPRSSLHYTPSDAEDFMDKLVEDLEKFSLSSRN